MCGTLVVILILQLRTQKCLSSELNCFLTLIPQQALKEAGAYVPESFDSLFDLIRLVEWCFS